MQALPSLHHAVAKVGQMCSLMTTDEVLEHLSQARARPQRGQKERQQGSSGSKEAMPLHLACQEMPHTVEDIR